jgi:hypothetical protein
LIVPALAVMPAPNAAATLAGGHRLDWLRAGFAAATTLVERGDYDRFALFAT